MIKILFICHGNICRSPMAEYILKDMVEKKKIENDFVIESCATSTEEIWGDIGNPIYPPAKAELRRLGIGNTSYTDFTKKRARQLTKADYDNFDYLICADSSNLRNSLRIIGCDPKKKLCLLMDFAHYNNRSISDPWYTGDFKQTSEDILEGLYGLLNHIGV